MNVTSLELCKELHAISGWDSSIAGGNWRWCQISPIQWEYLRLSDADAYQPSFKKEWFAGIPAYDLGYILRKLPKSNLSAEYSSSDWRCETMSSDSRMIRTYADTPEDAAAKLAIELFKQGILKNAQQK